jgi:hypothetical protein
MGFIVGQFSRRSSFLFPTQVSKVIPNKVVQGDSQECAKPAPTLIR